MAWDDAPHPHHKSAAAQDTGAGLLPWIWVNYLCPTRRVDHATTYEQRRVGPARRRLRASRLSVPVSHITGQLYLGPTFLLLPLISLHAALGAWQQRASLARRSARETHTGQPNQPVRLFSVERIRSEAQALRGDRQHCTTNQWRLHSALVGCCNILNFSGMLSMCKIVNFQKIFVFVYVP
jgi:hypothetical protein